MLSRALVPLLRPSGRLLAPRILVGAPSYQARRWYAKEDTTKGYVSSQQSQSATNGPTKGGSTGQFSDSQPEFESPANASQNTEPAPEDVARNSQHSDPVASSPNDGQQKEQEEIKQFASEDSDAKSTPESAQPLPDLTQGIPSTFAAEFLQDKSKQSDANVQDPNLNITEAPAEPASGGGGGGDDGLPKSEYVSSADRKRQQQFKFGYLAIFASMGAGILFLGRDWSSEAEEKKHSDTPAGWSPGAFYQRFKARLSDTLSFYNEPAFTKLLPDPDPDPLLRMPFTLVISLEDLLMHSEWTREHGWRIAKRPGVDYFLRYLSQYYELVVWTSQPMMMADPVIRKLDPFRIMRWPLFREATLYKNGEHVKDLSYLNRDLSKTLMIDTDPAHAMNQPENAIILPKWTGDPKDRTLVNLVPFLEYLAVMGVEDTRDVLKSFEGKDIPAEFARREQIMREKFEAKTAAEQSKKPSVSLSSLSSALGLKAPGQEEKPKMLWDQVRERGTMQYEAFEKEIRENGAKWLAEMQAEEKKAQEEALKSMKGGFGGVFGGSK